MAWIVFAFQIIFFTFFLTSRSALLYGNEWFLVE